MALSRFSFVRFHPEFVLINKNIDYLHSDLQKTKEAGENEIFRLGNVVWAPFKEYNVCFTTRRFRKDERLTKFTHYYRDFSVV